jgi:hypothetical protein
MRLCPCKFSDATVWPFGGLHHSGTQPRILQIGIRLLRNVSVAGSARHNCSKR